MLITKNLVFINNPKTGSSFVRQVIREIMWKRKPSNIMLRCLMKLEMISPLYKELLFPHIFPKMPPDQHGQYCQIPKKYKDRSIISIVRNPYDKFLSAYEFRHWSRSLPIEKATIKKHFPIFPRISLNEYVELNNLIQQNTFRQMGFMNLDIGVQTFQFIKMFFKNPNEVLQNFSHDYVISGEFKKDIGHISFLKQENLKNDLINLLRGYDYTTDELNFIANRDKVNVTKSSISNKSELWTNEALMYVEKNEYLLLLMLQSLGFPYEKPTVNFTKSESKSITKSC